MKKLTAFELVDLDFGAKIKVVWTESRHHNVGDTYYGIIFGDKIGYSDGLIDSTRTIAECVYNDWCEVYLEE